MQEYHSVPCQCFPKRRFKFEIPSAWRGKWLLTWTSFLFVSFMKPDPGTQCLLKNGIDLIELYNPYSLYFWGEGQLCLHTSPSRKIKERKKFRFHRIKFSFFTLMDYFILDISGSMVKWANNSGAFFLFCSKDSASTSDTGPPSLLITGPHITVLHFLVCKIGITIQAQNTSWGSLCVNMLCVISIWCNHIGENKSFVKCQAFYKGRIVIKESKW